MVKLKLRRNEAISLNPPDDRILSTYELCEKYKISRSKLFKLRQKGYINTYKVKDSKKCYFRESEYIALLAITKPSK